jgi:predicted lipoprotein with Yx(FWY)xxD motif
VKVGTKSQLVMLQSWRHSVVVTSALCLAVLTTGGSLAASTAGSAAAAGSSTTAASGTTPVYEIKTANVHGLGKILVDGQGFTLYVFAPDNHSGRSKCYRRCAAGWPPLVLPSGVSNAPAGPGVRASLLGHTQRKDGSVEVTYAKWPLYTWVIDSAPGAVTGQDINSLGGKWYVITPSGKLITRHL